MHMFQIAETDGELIYAQRTDIEESSYRLRKLGIF